MLARHDINIKPSHPYTVPQYLCHSSWTLNSFQGVLQTPGYPLNMPPRLRCEWNIIVQPGYSLKLDFKSIDIDSRDFIIVVSEMGGFVKLCGSQSNHTLLFENPGRVYLLLYTNAIRQGSGFQVYFKHISQHARWRAQACRHSRQSKLSTHWHQSPAIYVCWTLQMYCISPRIYRSIYFNLIVAVTLVNWAHSQWCVHQITNLVSLQYRSEHDHCHCTYIIFIYVASQSSVNQMSLSYLICPTKADESFV